MKTLVLETSRLLLRPLSVGDAEAAFLWAGDPRVNRYMIYALHRDIGDTEAWLSGIDDGSDDRYDFGIVRKEDGQLIGSGGICFHPEDGAWHFGYNLRFDCWGRGFATEAARRIIAFAREELCARDFASEHAVDNPASGKVIEKCGLRFSHEGSYDKADGSETFLAKFYTLRLG